ncbi:transglycosylase domain-containing protein [Vitreimonas flagellata]|uniref:transglycosylase domain-containing protein n=1 Tax=Vitreimonas flagellata TaxID=2560861 RepID=UPI003B834217
MRTIRTVVLVVLLAVVTIPVVTFAVLWAQAGSAISSAERAGVLRGPPPDTTLTVAERAISIAEFGGTWNARNAPCRPVASLWRAATQPDVRVSGSSVSTALSTMIFMELEPDRSLRRHFTRVLAACQLEQRYSDTQMLRAWLSNAYFGARPFGIESAAQSLFGKGAAELDPSESARLAALLRAPRLRNDPERWNERARLIGERVAASPQP